MKCHGFRKFFTNQLIESDVTTEYRWLLEGHSLKGNDSSYVRPTAKILQAEYEKAVNNLTINEENRLRMQVEKLEVEKKDFQSLAAEIAQIKRDLRKK